MARVIEVNKVKIVEYVSIEKQLFLDAQKYIERAEMYLKLDKHKYSIGCLIKAYKKIEKAEKFILTNDELSNLILKPIMDRLSKMVADGIMNGN